MNAVPAERLSRLNVAPYRRDGDYVLYWVTAARRLSWNFALDRALELARQFGKPLLVFEPLRLDHPWSSERLHRFVLDGMGENAGLARRLGLAYYPYVERVPGGGKGLLAALAAKSCAVVTDAFPCFFLPHMLAAAADQLDVALEEVDGNGLLPASAVDRPFHRLLDFRRHLQRELPSRLVLGPHPHPLRGHPSVRPVALDAAVTKRWPAVTEAEVAESGAWLADLPFARRVPVVAAEGGPFAARQRLNRFVADGMGSVREEGAECLEQRQSGLSPYLHFGHVGAHEVFAAVARHEQWTQERLSSRPAGSKHGWWGMSPGAEAFLDRVITWRELGFQFCRHRPDHGQFSSLPAWAIMTLRAHRQDRRAVVYSANQLREAETHDPLWNAAQGQLRRDGFIHGELRTLWAKKIIEWTESPEQALDIAVELVNTYALDGRDPLAYARIGWAFGLFDRPWSPERPIFGTVRYVASASTRSQLRALSYMTRFQPALNGSGGGIR